MAAENHPFQPPVVILANGPFPIHTVPLAILDEAGTVICTDGSADSLISKGTQPHVIIGDQDSTDVTQPDFPGLWIQADDQEKSDLHKSLDWCRRNGIVDLSIVGAVGERDDHSLTNLELLKEFTSDLNIKIITDFFTITCHTGTKAFSSFAGQTVSIFGSGKILTENLRYNLDNRTLQSSSQGISNESLGDLFRVESSDQVLVFRSHPE